MVRQGRVSTKTAVSKPELQRLLADLPFVRAYGFRVHSIGPGECILTVPFRQAFERPGGIVSGLVFMAAADVAMWLAIKTLLGSDDGCVTAEMKTSFLAAAKEQDFRCRAKIPQARQAPRVRGGRVRQPRPQAAHASHAYLHSARIRSRIVDFGKRKSPAGVRKELGDNSLLARARNAGVWKNSAGPSQKRPPQTRVGRGSRRVALTKFCKLRPLTSTGSEA